MYRIITTLFLGSLLFLSCKTTTHIADTEVEFIRVSDKDIVSDAEMELFIEPFRADMEKEMNNVIGYMPEDLFKSRPNSNMGNWFCDAMLEQAQKTNAVGVDFALQNYGGLRIPSVSKGPITKGKIFELMPFDNSLVILELDYKVLKMLLDKVASGGGWPISKNITFKIVDSKAEDIKIHDKNIEEDQYYRVALPDYIANGGDNCDFLIDVPQDNSGLFIREVIIDYLLDLKKEGKKIVVDNSKRIF